MTEKIKRRTLIGNFPQRWLEDSSPGVLHYTHLKLSSVKRLLENTSGTWQAVAEQQLRHLGVFSLFRLEKEKLKDAIWEVTNPFSKDVIFGLYYFKPTVSIDMYDILSYDILNFVTLDSF